MPAERPQRGNLLQKKSYPGNTGGGVESRNVQGNRNDNQKAPKEGASQMTVKVNQGKWTTGDKQILKNTRERAAKKSPDKGFVAKTSKKKRKKSPYSGRIARGALIRRGDRGSPGPFRVLRSTGQEILMKGRGTSGRDA